MLRLAHIADSHFDASSRFEECIAVHYAIAEEVRERGVDLVVHSGDVLERKSTPEERKAVAAWIQHITQFAPLIIVRGNHDFWDDLVIFSKLETNHPVIVEQGAAVHVIGGFVVGCLAWPTKASILALGAQSHAEGELLAGDALRNVLRGLGDEMIGYDVHDVCAPRILLAHAMVRGSMTSTGQPLVGCDFEVGIEDLSLARADFYALGHIHKGQDWHALTEGGEPIVYPGSPRRTAFGEVEAKGFVIADFDGALCTRWELVPTPCAPMLLLEDEWGDVFGDGRRGWMCGNDVPEPRGAEIRFRYHVAADLREEARVAAAKVAEGLLAAGAINVKVEPVVKPQGTARAPEVALAKSLADKMLALWKARRTTPDGQRQQRLLSKLADLEAKAS